MKVKTDKNLTNGPEIAKNMAAQLHKGNHLCYKKLSILYFFVLSFNKFKQL